MGEHSPHGYIIDIYFDSDIELKKAFLRVFELLPTDKYIFELNLRLHWQKHTITELNYELCRAFAADLLARDKHLNIFFKLPLCVGEKAQYATFPHCSKCAFFEAGWCIYPRQMGFNYYNVPQKNFSPESFTQIVRKDFEGNVPLTWYYPERHQFHIAAHQLEKSQAIVDFGSGNGFVTSLLQKELRKDLTIYAVEPHVQTCIENKQIQFVNEMPHDLPADWSLFSSLADFYVPLEVCMQKKTLPRDIVLIIFPDVFGHGGFRHCIELRGEHIVRSASTELFDIESLKGLGYKLLVNEKVSSYFYDNTEFRIYSRVDSALSMPSGVSSTLSETTLIYTWQNNSLDKKSAISTCDLS